jgi:hypothetical protein
MSESLPILKVVHTFNSMGSTSVEVFYDFITLSPQGRYLFENATLRESYVTDIDEGFRQDLIMRWKFHNLPAETFYVLKWSGQ